MHKTCSDNLGGSNWKKREMDCKYGFTWKSGTPPLIIIFPTTIEGNLLEVSDKISDAPFKKPGLLSTPQIQPWGCWATKTRWSLNNPCRNCRWSDILFYPPKTAVEIQESAALQRWKVTSHQRCFLGATINRSLAPEKETQVKCMLL